MATELHGLEIVGSHNRVKGHIYGQLLGTPISKCEYTFKIEALS